MQRVTTGRMDGGRENSVIWQGGGRDVRVETREAGPADAAALHEVAAATFALACPPSTLASDIAEFVHHHLSAERMSQYLADPQRELFLATIGDETVGYTMLIYGDPGDDEVADALTARPTVQLSKCYVIPSQHGSGVASALVCATVEAARQRGVAAVWLGVNQQNERGNGFYEKSGFRRVGTRHFLIGDDLQDDFVRELVF